MSRVRTRSTTSAPRPYEVVKALDNVTRLTRHVGRKQAADAKCTACGRGPEPACGHYDERKSRVLECLGDLYRSAYAASHERTVRDSVRTSGGDVSDGTLTIAAEKEAMRQAVARAGHRVMEAHRALQAAETQLIRALDVVNPPQTVGLKVPNEYSEDDVKAAREAQARRRARGEGPW